LIFKCGHHILICHGLAVALAVRQRCNASHGLALPNVAVKFHERREEDEPLFENITSAAGCHRFEVS